jgi:hypothetical protein
MGERERERGVSLKEAIVANLKYLASTIDEGNANIKQWWTNSGKVQPRYSDRNRSTTTLCFRNHTVTSRVLNPCLRGQMPAINSQ